MSAEDAGLTWYKSSYSGNEGGACVEIAVGSVRRREVHERRPAVRVHGEVRPVHVRDSKDVHRPHLSVNADGWAAFVDFAAAD
jgi:hypothetical protein